MTKHSVVLPTFFLFILSCSIIPSALCMLSNDTSTICENQTTVCRIVSTNITLDSININIPTLQISIEQSNLVYTNLSTTFYLNVSSITLLNSTLYFPDIHLEAPQISITSSQILTNGTQLGGPGSPDNPGNGVSYAGQGGSCNTIPESKSYGQYNTLYNDPNAINTFGSGVNGSSNSLGGGRVVIISNQDFIIHDSIINASGYGNCSSQEMVHGGSGGYVWIEGDEDTSNVTVDISGGQGCHSASSATLMNTLGGKNQVQYGLGGSGGRVVKILKNYQNLIINAVGGQNFAASDKCVNGAAGTVYSRAFNDLDPDTSTLEINNMNVMTYAATILPSSMIIQTLSISESALCSFEKTDNINVVVGSKLALSQGNITLNSTKNITLTVQTLTLQQNRYIYLSIFLLLTLFVVR